MAFSINLLDFIKKNKLLTLFLIGVIIILAEIGYIYYIKSKNSSVEVNGLKGYNVLYEDLVAINDSQLANNSEYSRAVKFLTQLKTDKTKDQQYHDLQLSFGYLLNAYASSNNHKIYALGNAFIEFAGKNFPDRLKPHSFEIVCMDPQCADSAIPSKLTSIIEEIKQSNTPQAIKDSFAKNLTNMSYISNKNTSSKAFGFLMIAYTLKRSDAFTKLGINEKLYKEVIDFIKITYPDDYKQLYKEK